MSKFVKTSLITAIGIMFIGSIIYMVGLAGGGKNDIRQMEEDGYLDYKGLKGRVLSGLSFTWWDWDHGMDADFWGGEASTTPETPEKPETPDQICHAEEKIDRSSVNKLEIELGSGYLYINQGSADDIDISVETENGAEAVYYVKDGTLHIEGFKKKKWEAIAHQNKNTIYVTLPNDMEFQESEIGLGAGYIEINGGSYGNTSIEVGAGEVACYGIKTGKLETEVDAGAVEALEIEADKIDVSVDIGAVAISESTVNGNIDLSCNMGSLVLELKDKEEAYNYEVDCGLGSILLGSLEYVGLGREKYIDNHASKKIKADCDMGSIEVIFLD